ncbi:MAG: GNAT family N-acetyltransferase [Candidatus Anstonellales archaeon]
MQIKIRPRRLKVTDAKELYTALSPEIFLYLKSPYPKSLEEEKRYLIKLIREMSKDKSCYYVYRKKGMGVVGFGGIKIKEHFAELSLWVRSDLWGRGIGKLILDHLQKIASKKNKTAVIASHRNNRRAIKLYLSSGFIRLKNKEEIIKMFSRYDHKLVYFLSSRFETSSAAAHIDG